VGAPACEGICVSVRKQNTIQGKCGLGQCEGNNREARFSQRIEGGWSWKKHKAAGKKWGPRKKKKRRRGGRPSGPGKFEYWGCKRPDLSRGKRLWNGDRKTGRKGIRPVRGVTPSKPGRPGVSHRKRADPAGGELVNTIFAETKAESPFTEKPLGRPPCPAQKNSPERGGRGEG